MSLALEWARAELSALERRGLRRLLEPLQSPAGAEIRIGGRTLLNFSSNDYLGLAADPRLGEAARAALDVHGVGTGASRLVVGDSAAHRSLEAALARFEHAESAVLFNTGYAANVGIVPALVGEGDVVFSDALNHASIIDGCRLSRAKVVVYPHVDLPALEALLRAHPGRRQLVVSDTVFSMDGDVAPLRGLVEVCRRAGAALMVDEAHATGVLGPTGAGLCEELGLESAVDVRMGTLGKAFGVFGAYAVGPAPLTELFWQRSRSLVFSTSLPPMVCAAADRAVRLVGEEPALRERLWRNIRRFSAGLEALGLPAQPRSAIFPVLLGAPEAAVEASRQLRARGVLVKPIRPPTVPEGTSRLRFALTAGHTEAQVDQALEALSRLEGIRNAA